MRQGKIQERNLAYYSKFPEDAERMYAILAYLEAADVRLPGGGILTPDYFLGLGIIFGMKGDKLDLRFYCRIY